MNKRPKNIELEDVLDAYVASGTDPGGTLDEWIRRYPEYEKELTEFAASWSLMEFLPPSPDAEKVDEETLVLRGMSVVQGLLHEQLTESPSKSIMPFDSLLEEGKAKGLKPSEMAEKVRLGDSSLRKLDRRLVHYASIPREVIEGLAQAIQKETVSVVTYLQQSPILSVATEHRSEQAPMLIDSEDFFDAVRADPTITKEDAAYWLGFEQSMGQHEPLG